MTKSFQQTAKKTSSFVETKLPCPCGESSDAFNLNADGSGFCFGQCGWRYFPKRELEGESAGVYQQPCVEEEDIMPDEVNQNTEIEFKSHWQINQRIFEQFEVGTKVVDGLPVSIGFPYGPETFKVRLLNRPKNESFYWMGSPKGANLFGKDTFAAGSKDTLVITEGEKDALSAYEILGPQYAVVSIAHGAGGALKDIQAEFEYVNSFSKIVICFDNDEAGEKAKEQVLKSGTFDHQKLFSVTLNAHKDANDYLSGGNAQAFRDELSLARRYVPNSIINSFSDIRNALGRKETAPVGNYPFTGLANNLHGLHRGEFILAKGLEGIGKTEFCRAVVHHLLKTTEEKIATVFLEESEDETIHGVATYELGHPTNVPGSIIADEDVFKAYVQALGNDESRLYIHTHFVTEDEGEIIDNIRFLVSVAGCSVVFLDNLTMLCTGREGEDERLRIDRIIRRLRDLCNELHFCLVLVAHVNDNGQTRGSRLPDKLCNTVIQMERNVLAATEQERNATRYIVEKARKRGGRTGPSGGSFFDTTTFKLRNFMGNTEPPVEVE